MAIKIETSKCRGIDNQQDADLSPLSKHWCKSLARLHPMALQRTEPTAIFNCHGLTFAARRTKIFDRKNIVKILEDDAYREINLEYVKAGDIIIYYGDDGDPNHSGVVVEYGGVLLLPRICSKWGVAGEFIHGAQDVPTLYGPIMKYYRCCL